jgi:hypothetical protein
MSVAQLVADYFLDAAAPFVITIGERRYLLPARLRA